MPRSQKHLDSSLSLETTVVWGPAALDGWAGGCIENVLGHPLLPNIFTIKPALNY